MLREINNMMGVKYFLVYLFLLGLFLFSLKRKVSVHKRGEVDLNMSKALKGHTILFLGSISYFFYLLHTRIVYALMVYLDINSMILWILLTTIISWSVFIIYNKLSVLFK